MQRKNVIFSVMSTRPEDLYQALSDAYNAGNLEAVLSFYDPKAVFVIKPSRAAGGSANTIATPI